MNTYTRVPFLFSIALTAFGSTYASTEIKDSISPNKKWVLTMKAEEARDDDLVRRCKVFLKNRANGKVLTSFNVEDFFAEDVRDTITAHWRKDSAAVALDITLGRNITECEVIVLANGQWKRLALPEEQLGKVRERNNEKDGKSQDYLTFDSWLPGGVKMSYQGNSGSVEDLECRIILGAKPHLKLADIADYTHSIELDPKCARCYYNRGSAYFEKEEYDAAIKDFDRALELDPKYGDAYYMRADIKAKNKQYEAAVKDIQKAIELDPNNGDYYLDLGWYQFFNRKSREAIAASLKALELSPDKAVMIKGNLAHGYLFDNQFDKAKAIYLENKGAKLQDDERSFGQAVLDDFKEFEEAGVTHPDMEKIKALLTTETEAR
jgi:tetratricopeptide (TPR) repeat protein